jgi:hypothetical protein
MGSRGGELGVFVVVVSLLLAIEAAMASSCEVGRRGGWFERRLRQAIVVCGIVVDWKGCDEMWWDLGMGLVQKRETERERESMYV